MLHLRLAATFAILGFVFTSKQWLQFLNKYNPETGLIIKHSVILLSIYILAWSDPYIKFCPSSPGFGGSFIIHDICPDF